ncbi:MAG: ABC transporter permease, partial [Gemmatimonadales bacterium]
ASRRRLVLLMSAISVGVGALVAINGFTDNLELALEHEARSLFGADLSVRSNSELEPEQKRQLDSLISVTGGADRSVVTSFSAMAYVPRTAGTRLVEVTAIEGGYPWYGQVLTEPDGAWSIVAGSGSVLVDPTLLTALQARVGDTLALGAARFRIAGTVTRMPGDAGIRALFGPRIWIAGRDVPETGLLQFGSRVEYETFLRLPTGANVKELASELRQTYRPEGIRVRTADESRENLTNALTRLSRYLGLVALTALLLGGLGVASAVHVFIRRKLTIIAILRCLGASAAQVTTVYLVQALAMGFLGSIAGVALGMLIQLLLPGVLSDFVPVAVSARPSWSAITTGLAVGCWVALVFSLLPLLAVRRVSPLAALRQPYEEARPARRDPWRIAILGLIALSVVALAILQVNRLLTGLAFAAGIGVVLGCLGLASFLLVRGLRRWFPSGLPYL